MSRFLRALYLAVAVLAIGIFAASCGSTSTHARFVNTISNGPNLDLVMNGSTAFTNVAFGSVEPTSGYKSFSSGSDPFIAYPTGTTSDPLISSNLNLSSSNKYLVVLAGLDGNTGTVPPAGIVLTDNNAAPASGQVNFRMVNASTWAAQNLVNTGAVDVYLVPPGTPLGSVTPNSTALQYTQASAYLPVGVPTGGTLEMDITVSGSTVPLFTQNYSVTAGQVRTVVLDDTAGGISINTTPVFLADLN